MLTVKYNVIIDLNFNKIILKNKNDNFRRIKKPRTDN